MRRHAVSVLGGRAGNATRDAIVLAEAIGAELGRRGYGLVSGGDDGIASAANRGCLAAGGETLALLKWNRVEDAGPDVTWPLPTSMDLARSNILNWACDGIIAFEGRYGTMAEIALALDTSRPLIVLGGNPFINPQAFDAPACRLIPAPRPEDAARIIDELEGLISLARVPPPRPDAALFSGEQSRSGKVALRSAVHDDLPMFLAAFSDPQVRQWWDLDPAGEALSRFLHSRCLTITEAARPIGFIEYHAEPDPDFDHLGLDIVIADERDRGRGLGSQALAHFAARAFAAGHHRITVVPSPGNVRAIGCYRKVGFQRVGTMRAYERYRGAWRDSVLFDLLPSDLAPRTGE